MEQPMPMPMPPPPPPAMKPAGVDVGMRPANANQYPAPPVSTAALLNFVLRLAVAVLTFLSTVVAGTGVVDVGVGIGVDGSIDRQSIKLISNPSIKYFVAATTIACAYSIVSLAISVAAKGATILTQIIAVLDVVIICFLFSAVGANCAITNLAMNGEEEWNLPKLCDAKIGTKKLCDHTTASIVLTMFASVAMFALVALSTFRGAQSRPGQ